VPEPLLDRELRIIPKRLPRARDVGERVPDVARARRLVDGVAAGADDLHKGGCKLVKADPAAAGDVEGPPGIALHRLDVRLDHVGDEGEVTGLLPVAVDDRGLAGEEPGDELRDHRGILGLGVLPGAVDVEVAQEYCPDAVEIRKNLPVALVRKLRDRVGGERVWDHTLMLGEDRGVAVDRGGRGGNHGRHPAVLRRDEHAHRAGHVRLVRGEGILHRPGHGGDGRLVEDAVRAGEGLHQEVEVGDAPLDERHPGMVQEVLDVLPPPGGEVVDDDDVVVLCQGIRKVRADEAGPAGDDIAHEEFTLSAGLGLSEWC